MKTPFFLHLLVFWEDYLFLPESTPDLRWKNTHTQSSSWDWNDGTDLVTHTHTHTLREQRLCYPAAFSQASMSSGRFSSSGWFNSASWKSQDAEIHNKAQCERRSSKGCHLTGIIHLKIRVIYFALMSFRPHKRVHTAKLKQGHTQRSNHTEKKILSHRNGLWWFVFVGAWQYKHPDSFYGHTGFEQKLKHYFWVNLH